MNFNIKYFFFTAFATICAHAQQDTIPKANRLDEVVITGQFNPQSVKKSVFQVNVITRADIDRQAGNNLADLLNQSLNITVKPSPNGKSGVSMFGLDAEYFKILVDNIPVISDEGLGNNIDLTQMNLDDVQQIEIVEGSMGVEYGANAVSGIINIITKKNSIHKWEITPSIQEESIRDEYNMNDMGRHIQSLKIGHNFNSKFYANAMITTNDFKGFFNDKKGEKYLQNDSLRGYEWRPKNQLTAKSLLSYSLKNHRIFYKFEYFTEDVYNYNTTVTPNEQTETATSFPTANDISYKTKRFFHNLNASGRFADALNYDISLSYQEQKRDAEDNIYDIRRDENIKTEKYRYESRQGIYSKGNFSNFLKNDTIDFLVGYEISDIRGYASVLATGDNLLRRSENADNKLGSYDVFAATEINISNKFSLRPGARALFSSMFDTQAAVSLSARYDLGRGYELRAVVGTAPKLPSYDELYTYLKDVNHDVQGNLNLKPEQGKSIFLHLNKTFIAENKMQFRTKFTAFYMDVNDRIELIIVNPTPLQLQFNNVDMYRTFGTSITSSMDYNNLTLSGGFTLSGVSEVIDEDAADANDDYLYGVQANANVSYRIPKWKTVFSAFLKYNGPEYRFVTLANGTTVKGKQNDFTFLDATIRKTFAKDKFEVTAGARNIFDIIAVNTTASGAGTHTAASTAQLLGYGRSYFLKLLYRFNF